ncbi:MAG: hypothetical protein ACRC3J_05225 [Culicoidibacterales bacterium]
MTSKTFKPMKFNIKNQTQSHMIQKELIKLGFEWASGCAIKHTDSRFIYAYPNGILTHCFDATRYDENEFPEYTIESKFNIVPTVVEVKIIPKDMIEIMGVLVPKRKVKLFLKMIDK